MFTVKHIISNQDEDCEILYQARHVTMRRGDPTRHENPRGLFLDGVNGDDGLTLTLSAKGSVAFVMNENGATISRYDL